MNRIGALVSVAVLLLSAGCADQSERIEELEADVQYLQSEVDVLRSEMSSFCYAFHTYGSWDDEISDLLAHLAYSCGL